MKKILIIFILISFISSCSLFESEDIKNAKKDLWVIDSKEIDNAKKDLLNDENERTYTGLLDNNKKDDTISLDVNKSSYEIEPITEKQFLKLDSLDSKIENLDNTLKITWKTIWNVDKIIVYFSNKDSNFVDDKFELKKFKAWDSNFEYNALLKYENLDFWVNEYLFEAYSWNDVSKLLLKIYKVNPWEWKENFIMNKEDISVELKDFPINWKYWNPVNIWSWAVTYSDIKWLEIKKEKFDKSLLNSNNIWREDWEWYLNKNVWGYVYWNTLRPVDSNNKNYWVSFYVLRKSGDKYLYEKLYFDFIKWYKATLLIEEFNKEWDDINKEMKELNKELKDKNDSYEKVKITDQLFRDLVNK